MKLSFETPALRIRELQGLWSRSLIAWPNGERDTTTQVRWLQGSNAYVDLRQPVPMPNFYHANGLDALTTDDCLCLAAQEGFSGHFSFDGAFFEWAREIDYQPKPLYSDAGSLHWVDDILVETGRDIAYIEHWHRDPLVNAAPAAAMTLRCQSSGASGRFLRVGPNFMYARDRVLSLTAEQHLTQCVAGSADVKTARAMIDCEISFGVVETAGCRISASTLPYRVGDTLDQCFAEHSMTTRDRAADGTVTRRHWEIMDSEGDATVLAASTMAH